MSHKASYSKFFTPPKFLEMPSVAIEILQTAIYFMSLKNSDKGLIPDQFGLVPIVNGDIVKALSQIRQKTAVTFARFSIPEEKTYLFKTHLPELKDKEIHDILDFKIEENVPLSSKEAVFDYDVIPSKKTGEGLDLMVSVAPLKAIEDLQTLFQSAGLTPIFCSPESNNVAKAVVRGGNEQVIVIVNIRDTKIIISLVVSGLVYQTVSLNFGGNVFKDILAKSGTVVDKLYFEHKDNLEIFSQIINTVSAIKEEVEKFIIYCNEQTDLGAKVSRVIIVGRDALIVGLCPYLSTNLNLPVEVANIWTNNFKLTDYVPTLSRLESLDCAVVNGLNLF